MEKLGLNELRERFLAYFESKDHLRLPGFSLIPQNDASLLLINSGMAPMKPFFTGQQEPPRKRVCTCQKCVRTGDIENIGKTSRHGTYFEMLGNFSFGDYFKSESLAMSWEFLTKVLGMDPQRLYPSIYEQDEEAFEIWTKEIGVPAERITRLGKADNFWEHGSGPCGPCSEIYYDRGEKYGCGKPDCAVGCDCDRFMEIWNNVFSQFNNDGQGNYTELVQKNIDTGMGLERLAVVVQDVDSLFDVDTVIRITDKVSEIIGAHYGESQKSDVSLRVITDHIRCSVMLISDGVRPSNEGRGYVLRRLLRRAARHGRLLGMTKPFLHLVVDTVVQENGGHYPELIANQEHITKTIRAEEESFAKTIDGGMKIFAELMDEYKAKNETVFSGADAFKLYDTYGFPYDLTVEMLEEADMTVDKAAFDSLMKEQKDRAREARKALGDLAWAGVDLGLDATPTAFVGYGQKECQAKVLALVADNEVVPFIRAGEKGSVVLDQTVMYAEMGGQVADHGTIRTEQGLFRVHDVQKDKGGKYLHHGVMEEGQLAVEDAVVCAICEKRREAVMRAHSATHLLQKALQTVLGDHAHQAGSFVEEDHLRFDFAHFSSMTAEEMKQVELLLNEAVMACYDVEIKEMGLDEAREMGAVALFGEKYGDKVRVVNMGGYSMELCGGTHVSNTGRIGSVKLLGESSVASGVRRIEAVCGKKTLQRIEELENTVATVADSLKSTPANVVFRAGQVMNELKEVQREKEALAGKLSALRAGELLNNVKQVGAVRLLTAKVEAADSDALRALTDSLRDKDAALVCVLAMVNAEGKINFAAACGKEAVACGAHAGNLLKAAAKTCGGGGGGRPDSATAGGRDVSKLEQALAEVETTLSQMLK